MAHHPIGESEPLGQDARGGGQRDRDVEAGVRLVARRPDFEFRPEEIRRFYCQGSPVLTHVCNAFAVQISPLRAVLSEGRQSLRWPGR